ANYLLPLGILFVTGTILLYIFIRIMSPRVFDEYWFENGMFNWGWMTGTAGMSVALLRVLDPENKSTIIEDYGLAYIGIVPFEIITLGFAPVIIYSGLGWTYTLGAGVIFFGLTLLSFYKGWFSYKKAKPSRKKVGIS